MPVERLVVETWAQIVGVSARIGKPTIKIWKIIFHPLAELKPDPANPRRHDKKQIKQIAKHISLFGFNVPVFDAVKASGRVGTRGGRVLGPVDQ
jgi:hypothetical protein